MRIKNIYIVAVFLMLAGIAGCSSGTERKTERKTEQGTGKYESMKGEFSFEMYDSAGVILCDGLLTLTMPDTVNVKGKIAINKVYKENFSGLSAIGKEAEGRYYEETGMLSLNTNPVVTDNNVFINLKAANDSRSLAGTWSQSTIAGVKNKGKFTAVKR